MFRELNDLILLPGERKNEVAYEPLTTC